MFAKYSKLCACAFVYTELITSSSWLGFLQFGELQLVQVLVVVGRSMKLRERDVKGPLYDVSQFIVRGCVIKLKDLVRTEVAEKPVSNRAKLVFHAIETELTRLNFKKSRKDEV